MMVCCYVHKWLDVITKSIRLIFYYTEEQTTSTNLSILSNKMMDFNILK